MADLRSSIVVGAFSNRRQADEAINALQRAGFQNDQIRQFAGKGADHGPLAGIKNIFSSERMTHGDLSRDLTDLGVAPEDIPFYQEEYEAGHPLVSVASTKRLPEATAVLLNNNAYIPTATHASAGRMMQRDTRADTGLEQSRVVSAQEPPRIVPVQEPPRTLPAQEPLRARPVQEPLRSMPVQESQRRSMQESSYEDLQEAQHMRLHAEQIRAYKQPTQVGEVILRKEVVTDQQTIDVPVRREEIVIERRSIAGDVAASAEQLGEHQTIRIPVSEDRVNLTKQIVATGEIVVGKRERQEVRHFSDIVQREEAHWEQKGDAHIIWEKGTEPSSPTQRSL